MRNTLQLLFILTIPFAITIISSCTKTCDEGYEGKHCTTEIREKFLHDYYNVSATQERDSCGNIVTVPPLSDTSSIIPGVNVNEIKITNVKVKSITVTLVGKVNSNNQITISQQIVSSNTFSGSGTYSDSNISLSYTAIKGCDTVECLASYTK